LEAYVRERWDSEMDGAEIPDDEADMVTEYFEATNETYQINRIHGDGPIEYVPASAGSSEYVPESVPQGSGVKWVLKIEERHGHGPFISRFNSEQEAESALEKYVNDNWDDEMDGMEMPDDDSIEDKYDLYFEAVDGKYSIAAVRPSSKPKSRKAPSKTRTIDVEPQKEQRFLSK